VVGYYELFHIQDYAMCISKLDSIKSVQNLTLYHILVYIKCVTCTSRMHSMQLCHIDVVTGKNSY